MAGKIRDEDIALVRERTSIVDVISRARDAQRRRRQRQGAVPVPRREDAVVHGLVRAERLLLSRLRRRRRRDQVRDGRRPPDVRRVGRAARRPRRHPAALRRVGRSAAAPRQNQGQKQRLVAAHVAAAEFYAGQLATPGARAAREFLAQRGFDRHAAQTYGCGFAPEGWDALAKHLRQKGYTSQELERGRAARSRPARAA